MRSLRAPLFFLQINKTMRDLYKNMLYNIIKDRSYEAYKNYKNSGGKKDGKNNSEV